MSVRSSEENRGWRCRVEGHRHMISQYEITRCGVYFHHYKDPGGQTVELTALVPGSASSSLLSLTLHCSPLGDLL